jgi:hypothetical protein
MGAHRVCLTSRGPRTFLDGRNVSADIPNASILWPRTERPPCFARLRSGRRPMASPSSIESNQKSPSPALVLRNFLPESRYVPMPASIPSSAPVAIATDAVQDRCATDAVVLAFAIATDAVVLAPGHGHVTLLRCAVAFAIATDAVGHRDAPIAVAQQQSSTTSEPIHYEVHIHNARGDHIKTTIDGEVVEEPDMKLIESDRSDGPDA